MQGNQLQVPAPLTGAEVQPALHSLGGFGALVQGELSSPEPTPALGSRVQVSLSLLRKQSTANPASEHSQGFAAVFDNCSAFNYSTCVMDWGNRGAQTCPAALGLSWGKPAGQGWSSARSGVWSIKYTKIQPLQEFSCFNLVMCDTHLQTFFHF